MERFLCVATRASGQEFLRAAAALHVGVTLLTLDSLSGSDWPRDVLEELATMPAGLSRNQILNTVTWMARDRRFDRLVALSAADLELVAFLREHMRLPGMGMTTAAFYRDRLGMRISARESGFPVIPYCRLLNYDELREFMETHLPPWRMVARREEGSRILYGSEQVWRALDDLGDRQSHFLLEEAVEGEVFCVDAVLSEREVIFSTAWRVDGTHPEHGEIEGTHSLSLLDRSSREWQELTALNAGLAPSLGMVRGTTHVEFLRPAGEERLCFRQIAAPMDAPWMERLIETATGLNPWREWARLEVAHLRGEAYLLPETWEQYAGLLLCPSEHPAWAALDLTEMVERFDWAHGGGLLLRGASAQRVEELLTRMANF